MAEQIANIDNGASFPANGDTYTNDGVPWVLQYVNGLDVSATYTVQGTHDGDADFSDAVDLGSTTVSSGASDRDRLTEEWDLIRVQVDATSPSSGTADAFLHLPR